MDIFTDEFWIGFIVGVLVMAGFGVFWFQAQMDAAYNDGYKAGNFTGEANIISSASLAFHRGYNKAKSDFKHKNTIASKPPAKKKPVAKKPVQK